MSLVDAGQRFTAADPCPVCGGHDRMPRGQGRRCSGFRSSDGRYALCTREEYAGALPLDTRTSPAAYVHRLDGPCRCGVTHGPAATAPPPSEPRVLRDAAFDRCPRPYPCDYTDENGTVLRRVARWNRPDGTKVIAQYRLDGPGRWIGDVKGVPHVIYRLPETRAAIEAGETIHVCEGEKKAHLLLALGFVATCNDGGAKKWKPEHTECMHGAQRVAIWPDNDAAGRPHAQQVGAALHEAGVSDIRVPVIPGLGEGEGLDDWISRRRGQGAGDAELRAEIERMIDGTAPWQPTGEAEAEPEPGRFTAATLSGTAVLDHAFPRPPSLFGNGVIAVGDLGVMFGEAGTSKTFLALQLALAQARGEAWMGLDTTEEPADVGFIELEIHGHTVQDRLRAIGGVIPATFHLLVRPQLRGAVDLMNAEGRDVHLGELREWIIAKQLKIAYIDALARATSCPQVDFSPLLLALDVLRAETACALVLIHHENARQRNGAEAASDMDFMRGDSRLRGFPQAVLRVLKLHGARCVRFAKVSCAATPEPIYFMPDENGVPMHTQAPEAAQREKGIATREKIACFVLQAAQPVSRAEVQNFAGLGRSAATDHLNALIATGRIDSYGQNRDTRYLPSTTCRPVGGGTSGKGTAGTAAARTPERKQNTTRRRSTPPRCPPSPLRTPIVRPRPRSRTATRTRLNRS